MAPSCGLAEGREGEKGHLRGQKTCAPPKSLETCPNRQGTWLSRERQRARCRVPIFRARADGLVCPPPVLLLCLCVATERLHGSHLGSRQGPHRDCRGADQGGRQPRPPGLGERFPHFTPPFLPQFQRFFHTPVDIGPSRWRLFGSTQFRAKMAEKMPQNKTTPFVR